MDDLDPNDIKHLFNNLATKYDYMNNIISFFTHKRVRKIAIKELNIKPNSRILDLCCGSGDFGNLITNNQVIGVDFSSKMLDIARKKNPNNIYIEEDATNLSFSSNYFDYVIMGFGLRNIPNKTQALQEIKRILKPNGYYLHLDFGEKNIITPLYNKIILFITKLFIKDNSPYKYLIETKQDFAPPEKLIKRFESNGFKLIKRKDLIFKTISFQIMQKTN